MDPKIEVHRGRIVKTTGDGLLAEFASVVDAVRCAVEVQRGMAARNAEIAADKRIEFRMGVNVGDIIFDGGDIFGVARRLDVPASHLLDFSASVSPLGLSSRAKRRLKRELDVVCHYPDRRQEELRRIIVIAPV